MLTNANKGTYLVKNWQKYANVIYERPLIQDRDFGIEAYRIETRTIDWRLRLDLSIAVAKPRILSGTFKLELLIGHFVKFLTY